MRLGLDEQIFQQAVGQLPRGHNLVLLDKLKNSKDRIWYAKIAIENNLQNKKLCLSLNHQTKQKQNGKQNY